ncbi:MAG: hypothetical protein ACLRZE_03645 [Streptococcus salivarius]
MARRFLATFFFPPILGITVDTLNTNIWWSMVPLSFVMLTVRIVDFILRLDFTDILKVAAQQEKKEPSGFGQHASFALLFSYLFSVDI